LPKRLSIANLGQLSKKTRKGPRQAHSRPNKNNGLQECEPLERTAVT
jgi:hypothetical protein